MLSVSALLIEVVTEYSGGVRSCIRTP